MNIEDIIHAWKADEDNWEAPLVASPVGRELTEEELLQVSGGDCVITYCGYTCNITCTVTCVGTVCGSTVCSGTACGTLSACLCSLSGATAG
jgi:hypothetical protein